MRIKPTALFLVGIGVLGCIPYAEADALAECSAFGGHWSGQWVGGRTTAITVTDVAKVNDSGCTANVRYAWGPRESSRLTQEEGHLDVQAQIAAGKLEVPLAKYDAHATFSLTNDGNLSGRWSHPRSKTLQGEFKRP